MRSWSKILSPAAACMAVTLAGCAGNTMMVPHGRDLTLDVQLGTPAGQFAELRNHTVRPAAGKGAGVGAAAGALSGLVCGPFFMYCSPAFAVIGTASGSLTGAGIGALQGWPQEDVDRVRAHLLAIREQGRHDAQAELATRMAQRMSRSWNLVKAGDAPRVSLVLEESTILATRGHGGVIWLRAALYLRSNREGIAERSHVQYKGIMFTSREWAAMAPAEIVARFLQAYDYLTMHAVSQLGGR